MTDQQQQKKEKKIETVQYGNAMFNFLPKIKQNVQVN